MKLSCARVTRLEAWVESDQLREPGYALFGTTTTTKTMARAFGPVSEISV